MNLIKKLSAEKKMDIIFYILLVITLPFKIMDGDYSKVFSIFLTFITVLFISFLFSKTKIKLPATVYCIALIFVFLSMYLGKIINLYRFFPHWDKFLHLTSGPILTLIGYIIFLNLTNKEALNRTKPIIGILFAVFFSVACAGCWEIFEYTSDNLFGLNAQNGSLIDTMDDIICGSIGGTLMGIIMYLPLIGKDIPFFKGMMIDIQKNLVKE